ncbi:hypothetical protein GQ43DRAFT_469949 [Delitschia confertaspora ATCC 74209]|uniref:Uncharacterized protein n=1 Tax=Delitschia confertaspora ATCC 74209 TaxID=1513339 RepID=A0A9P4JQD6_9PLEO|nr:hypothetical protein GQ43DRAFT_469949 [Delitschia confertaspora ATCC 74209]
MAAPRKNHWSRYRRHLRSGNSSRLSQPSLPPTGAPTMTAPHNFWGDSENYSKFNKLIDIITGDIRPDDDGYTDWVAAAIAVEGGAEKEKKKKKKKKKKGGAEENNVEVTPPTDSVPRAAPQATITQIHPLLSAAPQPTATQTSPVSQAATQPTGDTEHDKSDNNNKELDDATEAGEGAAKKKKKKKSKKKKKTKGGSGGTDVQTALPGIPAHPATPQCPTVQTSPVHLTDPKRVSRARLSGNELAMRQDWLVSSVIAGTVELSQTSAAQPKPVRINTVHLADFQPAESAEYCNLDDNYEEVVQAPEALEVPAQKEEKGNVGVASVQTSLPEEASFETTPPEGVRTQTIPSEDPVHPVAPQPTGHAERKEPDDDNANIYKAPRVGERAAQKKKKKRKGKDGAGGANIEPAPPGRTAPPAASDPIVRTKVEIFQPWQIQDRTQLIGYMDRIFKETFPLEESAVKACISHRRLQTYTQQALKIGLSKLSELDHKEYKSFVDVPVARALEITVDVFASQGSEAETSNIWWELEYRTTHDLVRTLHYVQRFGEALQAQVSKFREANVLSEPYAGPGLNAVTVLELQDIAKSDWEDARLLMELIARISYKFGFFCQRINTQTRKWRTVLSSDTVDFLKSLKKGDDFTLNYQIGWRPFLEEEPNLEAYDERMTALATLSCESELEDFLQFWGDFDDKRTKLHDCLMVHKDEILELFALNMLFVDMDMEDGLAGLMEEVSLGDGHPGEPQHHGMG